MKYRLAKIVVAVLLTSLRACTAVSPSPPSPIPPAPPPAHAAHLPTAPLLRLETGMHTASINSIATDAQGRWLVTASDDKTARIWELASARLLGVLRPPQGEGYEGKLWAVALSPDGNTVGVAGWTGDDREHPRTGTGWRRASVSGACACLKP